MKPRIRDYLTAIEEDGLEAACEAELDYLYNHYSTLGSVKKELSGYRNALRELDPKHPALKLMRLTADESSEVKRRHAAVVAARQRHVHAIRNVDLYLSYCESLLANSSYIDRLLGLAALTGRRTSELLCTARLDPTDDEFEAVFHGQLKTKEREDAPYAIPLLTDFATINKALLILQAQQRDLWGQPEKAGRRTHKPISTRVKALDFPLYLGEGVVGRDLRRAYAAIAFSLSGRQDEITQQRYTSDVLGHGADDNSTGASYMDYVVI